jgi:hypothetical protein
MNHLAGLRVCIPSRLFHRPAGDETKLGPDETIFPSGEEIPKPTMVNKALTNDRP